jgi:integrase/recombinase XerD
MSNDHLYKRGEVWWLRTTVAGREFRESLRCSDIKVARKRRDARLAQIEGAVRFGEVKHTWEEAVSEWATHSLGQIGRATAKRYAVSLKQCETFLRCADIQLIDGKTIQHLINQRRQVDKATPATVRRDLTAISRVLEYAEALEWREGNPTLSKRKLLRERRDPIVLPTSAQISTVVEAGSPRFAALIVAARLTGCRQDELTSLTWKQFQPKQGTLEVIGKGNKRRTIQLSEAATAHLDGTVRVLGSDLIFCTPQGTKWSSPASYFVKIRDRVAKANKDFKPFRFHDLRHLWAVEALRGGMGIYALSKHLGHTSVSVTERVYLAFLTPEEAEAAKAKAA